MSRRSLGTWMVLVAGLAVVLRVTPAFADSQVRIVRLSDVEGKVEADRNTGQGYQDAFLNMPMVQGMKLATKDGRAEVEFEDGSTLRLASKTTIEFTDLMLRDSGARVSTVTVKGGMVYVNHTGKGREDEFTVLFAEEKARLGQAVHFRLEVSGQRAELAVLNGELKVEGPSGQAEVSKNKTATFDLLDNEKFTIAKGVDEAPLDAWDKQQNQYHEAYVSRTSNTNYPYSYGVSDLNYYGGYYDVPGYGWMWQPFFTGVGWSPFADGAWMFYPGFGWMWCSAYPWGWMPYRYGSWNFVSGYGWMWAPGGWGGWSNVPPVRNPANGLPPPRPPARGTATLVVGHPTAIVSAPPQRLMVRSGSAGLGIPRGAVNNLGRVSHQVQQSGSVAVRTSAPFRSVSSGPTASGWSGSSGMSSGAHMSTGASHMGASSGGHSSAPSPHR